MKTKPAAGDNRVRATVELDPAVLDAATQIELERLRKANDLLTAEVKVLKERTHELETRAKAGELYERLKGALVLALEECENAERWGE